MKELLSPVNITLLAERSVRNLQHVTSLVYLTKFEIVNAPLLSFV